MKKNSYFLLNLLQKKPELLKKEKLNIILRGHIRGSFSSLNLYNLINELIKYYEIAIYIHTWNIESNNISYRIIEGNNNIISEDTIYNYFGKLKNLIKKIIIDDDSKIELKGNLEGTIARSRMPTIGWKRYLYGQHKILHYVTTIIKPYEKILNTRFDILNIPIPYIQVRYSIPIIINFVKSKYHLIFNKNIFRKNEFDICCDNLYISNVSIMYKFINHLYNNLDEILVNRMKDEVHQEKVFWSENNYLFNKKN